MTKSRRLCDRPFFLRTLGVHGIASVPLPAMGGFAVEFCPVDHCVPWLYNIKVDCMPWLYERPVNASRNGWQIGRYFALTWSSFVIGWFRRFQKFPVVHWVHSLHNVKEVKVDCMPCLYKRPWVAITYLGTYLRRYLPTYLLLRTYYLHR